MIYSEIDYNQIINNSIEGIQIERLEIGDLSIPTGQIVLCDPLAYPKVEPLFKTVSPGNYPVTLYIAKTGDWGDRIAIAVLSFNSQKADKYELALDYFPVDAGVAGFMDYSVNQHYLSFEKDFYTKNPNGNIYDDLFKKEFVKNATREGSDGDWINFHFPDKPEYNLTMFTSGYGDGLYSAYWGITNKGDITNLVIDFEVISLNE